MKQQGMVLIISLVMLIVMTILALSSMQQALINEKMAANSRDAEIAFQAAETALREAETWLLSQSSLIAVSTDGINRIWQNNAMDPDKNNGINWWQERDETWWKSHASHYPYRINNVKTSPYSVIEYIESLSASDPSINNNKMFIKHYYRITARGSGGSDKARVLLQSTVIRVYVAGVLTGRLNSRQSWRQLVFN